MKINQSNFKKTKNSFICQNCESLPAVVFYKADQLNVCMDCQNEIIDKHLESWYQENYKQALLHLTNEFHQQLIAEFDEENFTEISQEKEESHD